MAVLGIQRSFFFPAIVIGRHTIGFTRANVFIKLAGRLATACTDKFDRFWFHSFLSIYRFPALSALPNLFLS